MNGYLTEEDEDLAAPRVVGLVDMYADGNIHIQCDHPDDTIEYAFFQHVLWAVVELAKKGGNLRTRLLDLNALHAILRRIAVPQMLNEYNLRYTIHNEILRIDDAGDSVSLVACVTNDVKRRRVVASPVPFVL